MDPEYGHLRAVAEAAYIFTYPLVMNYADLYAQAIDQLSPLYSGSGGTRRRSSRGLPAPVGRFPEEQYPVAWLDLRAEPWVVGLPDAGVRRTRISDLWGFTVDGSAPSTSRDVGATLVMLASSSWVGEIDKDVDRIVRGESCFLRLFVAQAVDRPEDLDLPTLKPLSVHRGRKPSGQPPPTDWVPWRPGDEITDSFWSCANFALSLVERHPDDEPVFDRIADIGVVPGKPWDPAWFDAAALEAIGWGVDDALSGLLQEARRLPPLEQAGLSRCDTDRDYFRRALMALRDPSLIGVEAMQNGGAGLGRSEPDRSRRP